MKTVVLVHGWGMGPGVFGDLGTAFSAHYDVQAPPLPGYGGTVVCEPYRLEHLAARCAAAAPKRCHVLGWSLGGQVALAWASAHPQQVERLALIATTPSFVRRSDWSAAIDADVLRSFAAALQLDVAAALKRFVSLQAQGDAAARRVLGYLRASLEHGAVPRAEILHAGLKVLLDTDLRAVLPGVEQPALVVHGERDALSPCAAGAYLATALPRGRFALIPGAAHAPFVSAPDDVARSVLGFFNE